MAKTKTETPAVLFDLDGTLIDSVYEHVQAWWNTLNGAGIVVSKWMIHRRVGMAGKSFVTEFCVSLLQRKRSNIDELEKEHDARIRNVVSEIAPLRGADRLLAHLRRSKVRFAIATTGNREQTSLLLKKLKIPAGTPEMAGWMLTFLLSMESAEVLAGLFRIRPDSKRTLS